MARIRRERAVASDKQKTRHGLVLDTMEIAKRIDIEKIVLATEKKEKESPGGSG